MASSSLGHGAQAGADQPADGEEGGGDVDDEQGEGGDEHVQVELGWHPAALVPAAVHVAEHPHLQNIIIIVDQQAHLVPAHVDQLLDVETADQLCLLLQTQVVPVHQLADPAQREVAGDDEGADALEDRPDQVGLEEGGVVLEGLAHLHRVDCVLHTHFSGTLLMGNIFV